MEGHQNYLRFGMEAEVSLATIDLTPTPSELPPIDLQPVIFSKSTKSLRSTKSKSSVKKVQGINIFDQIKVAIIDEPHGPSLADAKILETISGLPFPAYPSSIDIRAPDTETVQKVHYTEAEEIVIEILNDIIMYFPSPSLIALNVSPPPKPEPVWPYFTPDEVVVHNTPEDCWVSFLGSVYNLTPLIEENLGKRTIKPILAFAGKDISDWFDRNGCIKKHVHPVTGVIVPYLPHGPIPDVGPEVPNTRWYLGQHGKFVPWWNDIK